MCHSSYRKTAVRANTMLARRSCSVSVSTQAGLGPGTDGPCKGRGRPQGKKKTLFLFCSTSLGTMSCTWRLVRSTISQGPPSPKPLQIPYRYLLWGLWRYLAWYLAKSNVRPLLSNSSIIASTRARASLLSGRSGPLAYQNPLHPDPVGVNRGACCRLVVVAGSLPPALTALFFPSFPFFPLSSFLLFFVVYYFFPSDRSFDSGL